jgi:hypothetical protein
MWLQTSHFSLGLTQFSLKWIKLAYPLWYYGRSVIFVTVHHQFQRLRMHENLSARLWWHAYAQWSFGFVLEFFNTNVIAELVFDACLKVKETHIHVNCVWFAVILDKYTLQFSAYTEAEEEARWRARTRQSRFSPPKVQLFPFQPPLTLWQPSQSA